MNKWKKRDESICTLDDYAQKMFGKSCNELQEEKDRDKSLAEVMELCRNEYIDIFSEKFQKAFAETKSVIIIGDYDCDGITATSEMKLTLSFIEPDAVVTEVIPKRLTDGYGVNKAIVGNLYQEWMAEDQLPIILTVDNGIAAKEALDYAKDLGFRVFVTDHHPIAEGTELPDAEAIIDLNVESEGYKDFCGAGVAFNVCLFLLDNYPHKRSESEVAMFKEMLLSICAQATIADVMPLTGCNRAIVEEGLKILSARKTTTGTAAFIQALGKEGPLQASDIAFYFAPCWNAPGRIYDNGAEKSYRLMSFNGAYYEALAMAKEVVKDNEQRKLLSEEATAKAEAVIQENGFSNDRFIVLGIEDLEEGCCGLVAGRVSERYHCPAAIFSIWDGVAKGSARSYGNIDIKAFLDREECSSLFIRYGGHAGAAGITMLPENIDAFRSVINGLVKGIPVEDEILYYDLSVKVDDLTKFTDDLKALAPFGEGNRPPVFLIKDFTPRISRGALYGTFSNKPDGIKLFEKGINALNFEMLPRFRDPAGNIVIPKKLDMLGELSENTFMGNTSWQIRMLDINPTEYTAGALTSDANKTKKSEFGFIV